MSQIFSNLNEPDLLAMILAGKVGVVPTDTVYGVVALAANEAAAKKLYSVKKRDKKPGTIIAADVQQLVELGIKKRYLSAIEHFWPNSISIVLPVDNKLAYLHSGANSLAIRIPKLSSLQKLLKKTGPLLTSSANQPSHPPANTAQEAKDYFGDSVDFYVDGGDLYGHQPSTIIRVVDDAIDVLREGSVKIDEETGRILQ